MNNPILKPTIVCDTCKRTLEKGDPGGEVQKKRCFNCVRMTTPGADQGKILKANGTDFETEARRIAKMKKGDKPREEMYYRFLKDNTGIHIFLVLELTKYDNKDVVLYRKLFSKENLEQIIEDITEYEHQAILDGGEVKGEDYEQ